MASSAENRDIEMTAKLGFSLECNVENVDLKMKEKRGVDGGIRS
jgi:hypothetical protein